MRDAAIDPLRPPGRDAGQSRASGAPPLDGMLAERPPGRGPKSAGRTGASATSAAIAAQRLGGGRSVALGLARGLSSPGLLARLRARLPRVRPFRALTIAMFSLALVGIVANALVFQRGHHPAPLLALGQSADGQPDATPRAAALVPVPPQAAPVQMERTGAIPPPGAPAVEVLPPVSAAVQKPAPTRHVAAKPRHEEAGGSPPPSRVPPATAHPRPGHAVASSETRTAAKPDGASAPRTDAVARLLAQSAHQTRTESKATADAAVAKPDRPHHVRPGAHSPVETAHHRLATADVPVDGAKSGNGKTGSAKIGTVKTGGAKVPSEPE